MGLLLLYQTAASRCCAANLCDAARRQCSMYQLKGSRNMCRAASRLKHTVNVQDSVMEQVQAEELAWAKRQCSSEEPGERWHNHAPLAEAGCHHVMSCLCHLDDEGHLQPAPLCDTHLTPQ